MSKQTSTQTVETYLPATFLTSGEPGFVERLLTKPFRREAQIWLSDD